MCPAEASLFQEHPRPPPAACLKWRGCPRGHRPGSGLCSLEVCPRARGGSPQGQGTRRKRDSAQWAGPELLPGHAGPRRGPSLGTCVATSWSCGGPGVWVAKSCHFPWSSQLSHKAAGLSPFYRRRNKVMSWPEVSQRDQDWTPSVQPPTPISTGHRVPPGSPSGPEAQLSRPEPRGLWQTRSVVLRSVLALPLRGTG